MGSRKPGNHGKWNISMYGHITEFKKMVKFHGILTWDGSLDVIIFILFFLAHFACSLSLQKYISVFSSQQFRYAFFFISKHDMTQKSVTFSTWLFGFFSLYICIIWQNAETKTFLNAHGNLFMIMGISWTSQWILFLIFCRGLVYNY